MPHNPKAKAHQPLTADQQDLVKSWHRFAIQQTSQFIKQKRIRDGHPCLDTLWSECHMSMVHAAQSFKPETGRSFGTYLGTVLRNSLPKALASFLDNRIESIGEADPAERDQHINWSESSWQRVLESIEDSQNELTAQIAVLRFRHGMRKNEISNELGVSRQVVKECLDSLRSEHCSAPIATMDL